MKFVIVYVYICYWEAYRHFLEGVGVAFLMGEYSIGGIFRWKRSFHGGGVSKRNYILGELAGIPRQNYFYSLLLIVSRLNFTCRDVKGDCPGRSFYQVRNT